jgi:hypothetical protein
MECFYYSSSNLSSVKDEMAGVSIPPKMQAWVAARRKHKLSHAHVMMARELGMNPKKLGGLDNHRQESWKMPLPEFIEYLYRKTFGRSLPDRVMAIEEIVAARRVKTETKRDKAQSAGDKEPNAARDEI